MANMSQQSGSSRGVELPKPTASHMKPHHRRRTQEPLAYRRRKMKLSNLMFVSLLVTALIINQIAVADQIQQINTKARRVERRHTSNEELATNHHEEPLALGLSNEQQQQQQVARGKRTLYACEEKQLEIECQLGESIQLIRANYGRFSIQICNEHGQLDWKVNCMSADSFEIITRSCQAKQSCQLLASNEIFGDACPGTQKYLEVHYQCVPAGSLSNRTFSDQQQQQQQLKANGNANQVRLPPIMGPSKPAQTATTTTSTSGNNVIRAPDVEWTTSGTNSETVARMNTPSAPALPDWMRDAGLGVTSRPGGGSALVTPIGTSSPANPQPPSVSLGPAPQMCPETERRGMRFHATLAGQEAQAACPADSVAPHEVATLFCRHDGQWAARAQAGRCQSAWLRNLTQLLDTGGDSPLSILNQLAHRTRGVSGFASASATWLPVELSRHSNSASLFGSDLVLIGRIISRLVDRLVELLNSILDDKQRAAHARDIVQALVEVINNLSGEQQLDGWQDLNWISGERQRVAGQLVASLESACVLLAGAFQQQQQQQQLMAEQQQPEVGQVDFHKSSEFVLVAIESFPLSELSRARVASGGAAATQNLQVTLPSAASVLGTKWMNSEQRFVLHLQASQADNEPVVTSSSEQATLQLKVVFVQLRSLGAQMDPRELSTSSSSTQQQQQQQHLSVNSDLVSFSIVADSRRSLKVDLSAPIELVFKHQRDGSVAPLSSWTGAPAATNQLCAHWELQKSDWLKDGCKLVAANETHSVCSCNQLTTFALLANTESDASQQSASAIHQSARQPIARLHLDAQEAGGEQIGLKTRLFEGTLLASDQTTRALLHLSCVLAALLLALLLVAAAYNRAHARRLLGSMPSEPPPSLLVASSASYPTQFPANHNQLDLSQHPFSLGQTQQPARNPLVISGQQQSLESATSPSQPTSYSSELANSDLSSGHSNNLILHKNTTTNHNNNNNSLDQLAGTNANQTLYSLMANGGGADNKAQRQTKSEHSNEKQVQSMALVPLHVIGKLFVLQLLLLLLVESQTMLRQNAQAAREAFVRDNLLMMRPYSELAPQQQQQQQLDPVGLPTWLALFGLYYLASALLFWLLAQLVLLNGLLWQKLMETQRRLSATSSVSSYQPIQTISALYQGNRYGQCQVHNQHTGSSPSLSNFSSSPATLEHHQQQRLYATNQRHHQQQQLFAANGQSHKATGATPLDPLYGVRAGKSSYASQMRYANSGERRWQRRATKLATSRPLNWTLAQAGPIVLASLLLWLAHERAQQLNRAAYTSAHTSQLAYWPLLLDAPASTPLALLHLYCLPSICLALGVLALVLLRRHMRQLAYGAARNEQRAIEAPIKAADGQYESARAIQLALETKSARFSCLTLLGLLVLNSICWLAFFVHCQQALGQSALVESAPNNTLMLTFAASNLLIAVLICCSQRRTLRRAAQLAGWTRLLLPARSSQSAAVIKSTPSPSTSHSSELEPANVYYSSQAQQQQQQYGKLNAVQQPTGSKLSNSPSQHSLFVISRSRPQVAYGQHFGHEQALMLQHQQQQQHLYQQLALSQQHLYDSTSNLQQQAMGGGPYNLHQQQHMTLRPQHQQQLFARNPHDPFAICPSAGAHAKTLSAASGSLALARHQQQQQQTGEADGPLVALAGSTSVQQQNQQRPHQPTTTFGPNTSQMSASYQQQQTTELQPSNGALEANQRLMMMNRAMATNMGAQALTIGNGAKTQQQQQTATTNNNKQNQYFVDEHADELHQQQQQQHFRRANSASRQQPSRSFASAAMMIDAPQLIAVGQPMATPMQQQHKRLARPLSSGSSADESSNIYDVANCVP